MAKTKGNSQYKSKGAYTPQPDPHRSAHALPVLPGLAGMLPDASLDDAHRKMRKVDSTVSRTDKPINGDNYKSKVSTLNDAPASSAPVGTLVPEVQELAHEAAADMLNIDMNGMFDDDDDNKDNVNHTAQQSTPQMPLLAHANNEAAFIEQFNAADVEHDVAAGDISPVIISATQQQASSSDQNKSGGAMSGGGSQPKPLIKQVSNAASQQSRNVPPDMARITQTPHKGAPDNNSGLPTPVPSGGLSQPPGSAERSAQMRALRDAKSQASAKKDLENTARNFGVGRKSSTGSDDCQNAANAGNKAIITGREKTQIIVKSKNASAEEVVTNCKARATSRKKISGAVAGPSGAVSTMITWKIPKDMPLHCNGTRPAFVDEFLEVCPGMTAAIRPLFLVMNGIDVADKKARDQALQCMRTRKKTIMQHARNIASKINKDKFSQLIIRASGAGGPLATLQRSKGSDGKAILLPFRVFNLEQNPLVVTALLGCLTKCLIDVDEASEHVTWLRYGEKFRELVCPGPYYSKGVVMQFNMAKGLNYVAIAQKWVLAQIISEMWQGAVGDAIAAAEAGEEGAEVTQISAPSHDNILRALFRVTDIELAIRKRLATTGSANETYDYIGGGDNPTGNVPGASSEGDSDEEDEEQDE